MSEAVCLYDKDHVLLFLNDMFAVMHGFAPGETARGMKIEDVLRLLAERDEFGPRWTSTPRCANAPRC
jgi:hypothetical protein